MKDQKEDRRYRAAIIIASDRAFKKIRADETGPILKSRLIELGFEIAHFAVLPDDKSIIVRSLKILLKKEKPNLIIIAGGTGPAPSDVTPEATMEVIEKRVPGMEETMRRISSEKTPHAMLSRAVVGISEISLIINLPGSPAAAVENLAVVEPALDHALRLISGENPHE